MTIETKIPYIAPVTAAFSGLYRRIRQLLGQAAAGPAEPKEPDAGLCLAQATQRAPRGSETALPESLLQAFSSEPLAAGDPCFIGREAQFNRILAAIESWRAGRDSMVAVTGSQGCGLTSFLQQLEEQADGDETFRYKKLTNRLQDVDGTLSLLSEIAGCGKSAGSIDELLEQLNALPPSVIAIDNGHFLSSRVMGAKEAIRVFGSVMVATQHRHFWMLACEEFAWRRLTYIHRAERYFTDRIELSLFSETELGLCLDNRLRTAAKTLNEADGGAPGQTPDALARALPTLYNLSKGKPDLAFFYFLGSLVVSGESGRLEPGPVTALDFSLLKGLIAEEMFTLAEIAVHGRLTIDDHRAVFRYSHEQSWLLLEHLYHRCLLDREMGVTKPAYRLVPRFSQVIAEHLTNTNYLY